MLGWLSELNICLQFRSWSQGVWSRFMGSLLSREPASPSTSAYCSSHCSLLVLKTASLCVSHGLSSVCIWVLISSYNNLHHKLVRAYPNDLILTQAPHWKILSPNQSLSEVLGLRTSTYEFQEGGTQFSL